MSQNVGQNEVLIEALAKGMPIVQAAKLAGVSAKTVHRRLKSGDFQQRIRDTRSRMFDNAVGGLAGNMRKAVKVLRQLLDDPSSSIKLSASKSILEVAQRLREAVDLEQRLSVIEAKLKEEGRL